MRLGLYQSRSPAGDIPAGLAILSTALAAAAQSRVDMLVMPELFLPGYNSVTATPPEGWDEVETTIAGLARTHGVGLTIGLPEYDGPRVYNSAMAYGADGTELARFRKVQLFGPREHGLFTPGDRHVTFDYKGQRFGLLICYDVEFPEHTRALARAGVKVVLCPTANMMPFVNVNLITVPSRAAENAMTVVYANYTGSEGDLTYVGYSVIAGPDGYPLGSEAKGEGLVVAELPDGLLENAIPFSTQLADYRPVEDPAP